MALSSAHTYAKAAHVAKLLLFNKCPVTLCPHLTMVLTLTKCDPDYHKNLMVSSVALSTKFVKIGRVVFA